MGFGSFKVHRRLVAQSAVEPFWVIERFDIIKDGRVGLLAGLECVPVQPFGFECAPERLHGGVVITMTLNTHAGLDAAGAQQGPKAATGVLHPPI